MNKIVMFCFLITVLQLIMEDNFPPLKRWKTKQQLILQLVHWGKTAGAARCVCVFMCVCARASMHACVCEVHACVWAWNLWNLSGWLLQGHRGPIAGFQWTLYLSRRKERLEGPTMATHYDTAGEWLTTHTHTQSPSTSQWHHTTHAIQRLQHSFV